MVGPSLKARIRSALQLTIALCLLLAQRKQLVESSFEFDKAAGLQQRALDYYVSGKAEASNNQQRLDSNDNNLSPAYLVDEQFAQTSPDQDDGVSYQPLELDWLEAQKLGLLFEQPSLAPRNQEDVLAQPSNDGNRAEDINGDQQELISGPINDPREFATRFDGEFIRGNGSGRIAPLEAVLSARLDILLSELLRRQEAEGAGGLQLEQRPSLHLTEDNNENDQINNIEAAARSLPSMAPPTTEVTDQSESEAVAKADLELGGQMSTTSASRYGGGEYIDHPLALVGHQYVQGGAGEGRQLLGPDGTFENVQVVKTDHAVPSYCDPPNPCPIGYSAEDGCLEKFVNSASFSREYQAKQECNCDNEHSLFECASPISTLKNQDYTSSSSPSSRVASIVSSSPLSTNDDTDDERPRQGDEQSGLDALARTIQNRFGSLSSVRNLIAKHHEQAQQKHQLRSSSISKKAYNVETDFKY